MERGVWAEKPSVAVDKGGELVSMLWLQGPVSSMMGLPRERRMRPLRFFSSSMPPDVCPCAGLRVVSPRLAGRLAAPRRGRFVGGKGSASGRGLWIVGAGCMSMPPAAAAVVNGSAAEIVVPWVLAFLAGCLVGAMALSWTQRHRLRRAHDGPDLPWWRARLGLWPVEAALPVARTEFSLSERLAQIESERLAWRQGQLDLLDRLWRQVRVDALTGLPSRRAFVAGLDAHLGAGVLAGAAQPSECAGALLLLRVRGLDRLNRRSGREAGDGLLAAVGGALRSYHDRVPGALGGRLSGGDFALFLPVPGLAEETAAALHSALQPAATASSAGAEILVAGVDELRAPDASHALAQADEVLAEVEAGASNPAVRDGLVDRPGRRDLPQEEVDAAELWRLASGPLGALSLSFAPVVDKDGLVVARLCALRLGRTRGSAWIGPRSWIPRLRRAGLLAQADLAAVMLALVSAGPAGRVVVPLSAESAIEADFVSSVTRRLIAAPWAAASLTLEVEAAPPLTVTALRSAVLPWVAAGATVSLLLRGSPSPWVQVLLADQGVSALAVDVRFLRQAGTDAAAWALVGQLALVTRAMGLGLHARELVEPGDRQWLREAGFDCFSGAAVAPPETPGTRRDAVGAGPGARSSTRVSVSGQLDRSDNTRIGA